MKTPFLLLLDGMMGSGKTVAASLLADQIPRTAIIGMDRVKRFVSDFERGTRDNGIAREVVHSMARTYIENDISVIVEQSFKDTEWERYDELASDNGIPLYRVQLFAEPDIVYDRIAKRQEASDDPVSEERIHRNLSLFRNRQNYGFTVIDTSSLEPKAVADRIMSMID